MKLTENLKQEILKVIDDHSGGIKSLELLPLFFPINHIKNAEEFHEIIESITAEIPEIGVLYYHANAGEIVREKHFLYRKANSKKIVRKGFVQAMNGQELWVNTETDEIIKFFVKDDKLRNDLYCRPVTITFEFSDKP